MRLKRTRTYWLTIVLATSAVLGACTDGPSSPITSAAVLEAVVTDGQTAVAGSAVSQAPTVVVRDDRGDAVEGAVVRFAVTRGGGVLAASSVRTDVNGLASAGEWTLGASEGLNEVTASVGRLTPVRFTATAVSPVVPDHPVSAQGEYGIDVRYIGNATARQRHAVTAAIARWRSVIVADLPSIPLNAAADACFDGQPAINEVVDDILMYVEFLEIDGRGKVLGEAGPCYVRTESQLPVLGYLKLDAADLAQMESAGTLDDVVLHEIGHVLGIGTMWSPLLTGAGGPDPVFHGRHAMSAYLELGAPAATGGVPVENTGGSGTRDGHWRESVFGNELMTGFIGGAPNPLSALTVASLKDLGYGTSVAGAGGFTLGSSFQSMVTEPVDLRGRERIRGPRFRVDRAGRTERLGERHPVGPVR